MAASALDAPVIMFFKNSLCPGASMMAYWRRGVRKGISVVSIVTFCFCSSRSASSKKANSNPIPSAAHAFFYLLNLAFRKRAGVMQNATDQRGLPVIDMADENDAERRRR